MRSVEFVHISDLKEILVLECWDEKDGGKVGKWEGGKEKIILECWNAGMKQNRILRFWNAVIEINAGMLG